MGSNFYNKMANRRSTINAPRPNIVADIGLKDIGLSYEMQKSIDSLDEKITPTEFSLRMKNPIREIFENMDLRPNPEKEVIKCSLGDPTVYGNFPVPKEAKQAVVE